MATERSKVYACPGDMGTELRAAVDILPGEVLLREPAFAFACEDDDDDGDTLPAIVQVAMDALILEAQEIPASSGRVFKQLVLTSEDSDDPQRGALFAWGADQIMSRLATNNDNGVLPTTTKDDIMDAIRRVSLNSFTVKSLMETEVALRLDGDDDFDLIHCLMQIGAEEARGVGLYLLSSAANHSCSPNTFVTFADHPNNEITFRATKPIQADEAITISYGPVVGVDDHGCSSLHHRKEELLASHGFHCQCTVCITEETTRITSSDDFEAMQFIERVIVGNNYTASEALQEATNAPINILRSGMFGKAMTDTSLQVIAACDDDSIELAIGFQKLALKSMELRCPRDHVAIAYELIRLSLLRACYDSEVKNVDGNAEIERAQEILRIHYGEEFAYKQTLETLSH
mmetsp:Transcript_21876/g.35808  ORF Transcript_21876/g.35808 Transcript_21876/m.35808 type:complete len:404 (-) Transcript_21876:214-1425(-)